MQLIIRGPNNMGRMDESCTPADNWMEADGALETAL